MAGEDFIAFMPAWIRDNVRARELWIEGAGEFGYENALEYVQQQPEYDLWFPGNRREDGSVRYSEDLYLSTVDGYKTSLKSVGIDPSIFENLFPNLIEGDVSSSEFWQERVAPAYDQIMMRGQSAIDRYATDWGLAMTREALVASLLDPEGIGNKILQEQISISEIRYEADMTLGSIETNKYLDLTDELYRRGTTVDQARTLFQQADVMMPMLSILAGRHADPDDDFDLEEFTAGTLYNDPDQARRIRRLMAQEQSLFTGGRQTDYVSSQQTGGVSGLVEV